MEAILLVHLALSKLHDWIFEAVAHTFVVSVHFRPSGRVC